MKLIHCILVIALLMVVRSAVCAQSPGFALQFDGVNDYVDLPESASLTTFTNRITIEVWLYSDSWQNAGIMASGNQNDYALGTQPNGQLRVDLFGIDAVSGGAFFSKSSLATGRWYHIAMTYDGAMEKILIDGQVDTARSASGNLGSSPQSEDIRIGSWSGDVPNFYRGKLDEVRIWNLARTQSEIQQNMYSTLTGSEEGLVGYWRFNEGSGDTTADATSNGNTGTLVNGPQWVTEPPLPIQLGSFCGERAAGSSVRINWATVSEINNYGFYVQRRLRTEDSWAELPNSFIPGHGTTNEPHYYSFRDNAAPSGPLQYRLKQVDLDGTEHLTEPIEIMGVTSAQEESPKNFSLWQNYPNPFNPTTTIAYELPENSFVKLEIVDVLGRIIADLESGFKPAGRHASTWDAANAASGAYLARYTAVDSKGSPRLTKTLKLLLAK